MTLDRLLVHLEHAEDARLDANTVVVVDEASMVGTRKLAQLLEHAEPASAKVVLVGDHYQLPEIDAGGAFAGLAEPTSWRPARREPPPNRTLGTRARSPNCASATRTAPSPPTKRTNGYVTSPSASNSANVSSTTGGHHEPAEATRVMLATRNTDVDDLNQRARRRLAAAGTIGPDQLDIDGRRFAVGDEILTTRNDYRLGVLNGTRATITHIDDSDWNHPNATPTHARRRCPADVRRCWPRHARLRDDLPQSPRHDHPLTFVLADNALDRAHAYTALSRGTQHNAIYIAASPDDGVEERHAPEPVTDAVARARETMRRLRGKSMASDQASRAFETPRASAERCVPEPPGLAVDLGT